MKKFIVFVPLMAVVVFLFVSLLTNDAALAIGSSTLLIASLPTLQARTKEEAPIIFLTLHLFGVSVMIYAFYMLSVSTLILAVVFLVFWLVLNYLDSKEVF